MTSTTPPAALIPPEPVFTNTERLALAGFLAGYSGLTRQAYELDLRQYVSWCHQHHLRLFQARRADIECFARDLETRGRARATITRRLCTIAGFYRYAVEEDLLDHSPAAHVRRPRRDDESHATGLDRNELGALPVAAGLGAPAEHALISLLALNGAAGLRSHWRQQGGPGRRARAPDPGDHPQGRQGRHHPARTRTARAIDLAAGERAEGPIFLTSDGQRLDRHGADRPPGRHPRRDHQTGQAARCGTRSSPPPSTPACRSGTSRTPPRTPIHAPRCASAALAAASTGTPTYIVAAYLAGAAR
jgi:integrase/recombinase XerD